MSENKEKEELWDNLWFLTRVAMGILVQVLMIICSAAFVEAVVELTLTLKDYSMSRTLIAMMVGVSSFASAMSGVYWVKQQYIHYFLPEVMDEMSKKINT